MTQTMRAMSIEGRDFAPTEIARPDPAAGQVRVRVEAAALNPADAKIRNGEFAARFLHAKITPLVLGFDFAGTVDACGDGVDAFAPGDPVWGHLPYAGSNAQGSLAEYVVVPVDEIGPRPEGVSAATAAGAATVGLTALQGLRDQAGLGEGGRAMIVGAGGGVGSLAVGVARRLGATVTGVCSTKDVDRVEALGADAVIDRKHVDPTDGAAEFDVVFDTPAAYSFGAMAGRLRGGGTYLTTLPSPALFVGILRSLVSSKRCKMIVVHSRRADLETLGAWLADGLEVPIDAEHPVRDVAAAFARLEARDRQGRVVVTVADGW